MTQLRYMWYPGKDLITVSVINAVWINNEVLWLHHKYTQKLSVMAEVEVYSQKGCAAL